LGDIIIVGELVVSLDGGPLSEEEDREVEELLVDDDKERGVVEVCIDAVSRARQYLCLGMPLRNLSWIRTGVMLRGGGGGEGRWAG